MVAFKLFCMTVAVVAVVLAIAVTGLKILQKAVERSNTPF
jgi:hypothetical protein